MTKQKKNQTFEERYGAKGKPKKDEEEELSE